MLGRLVDEVQPAIPRDPVVDVNDQIAFVQVEEAVDGAALVAPASDRPADLGAGEELVIADHERLGVDQVEARPDPADGQVQPFRLGQLGVGKDLAQPFDFGRVVAGDQDVFAGGRAVELGLDLRELARKSLDALDPQVAGRLERVGRQGRDGDRGQADQALEAAFDGEEPAHVFEAAEILPALLAEVGGLEQGDPGSFGKVIDGMAEARQIGFFETERGRERDRVPAIERALGFDVEGPDRFDLVAEKLDADRVGRIRGEDVEDAAADAELAGYLDDLGPRHSALEQPCRQLFDGHGVADGDGARHPRQRLGLGHRLKGRLKRRDDQPRRAGARELLEHPHPPAENFIGGVQLARQLFPGREDLGNDPRERGDVVAKVVDVADVGQQDHHGGRRVQPKRGRHQGRRRAPGTVDRRAAAVLERGHDLGKPRRAR